MQVGRIRNEFHGRRDRPLVRKSLAVDVEMWARNFFVVRITMRWTGKVQTQEYDYLTCTGLKRGFGELDLGSGDIQVKRFAAIYR
jgi:hypothetical protein